jgi:shikimate kinase
VNPSDRSIVLIGFMGTGKSSVGRRLARLQRWPRFDTDAIVARELGMPIMEIFTVLGEERFREEESTLLEKLDATRPSIIVTGGGTVLRPRNIARLRELGTVVCLTANLTTLRKRLARRSNRPVLQTENPAETIELLLREREPSYRSAADLTIDTSSLNHDEVAASIRQSLALGI